MHRRRPGHRLGLGASLRLLVLGGTAFLGRHLVESALERGHEVTLFNRGLTNPGLFQDVERLAGDRNGDLGALRGRTWDAGVDTSAYFPRQVRAAAAVLQGSIGHYSFVSSGSVYPLDGPKSEDSPTLGLGDPASEDLERDYGALKAACERAAAEAYGEERVLCSRSGLIVGPWDPTNRFTYWPVRIADGGDVLAPGAPGRQVQFIHARDQADWLVDCAERGVHGVFNCSGPRPPITMEGLLEACRSVAASGATLTWVADAFLVEQGVEPWSGLPLWLPPEAGTLSDMPVDRALAAGLRLRPPAQTVAETLAWARAHPTPPVGSDSAGRTRARAGLAAPVERRVLDAWHARAR